MTSMFRARLLQPCTRAHARKKNRSPTSKNWMRNTNERYRHLIDIDKWNEIQISEWVLLRRRPQPLTSQQHHVVYDGDLSYSSSRCEGFVLNQYPAFHKHTLSIRGRDFVLMYFYRVELVCLPSHDRIISQQQRFEDVT